MSKTSKVSVERFINVAIDIATKKHPKYKNVHTVYDGFNAAFKQYFGRPAYQDGKQDAELDAVLKSGRFVVIPRKGGAAIYRTADAPAQRDGGENILKALK